MFLKQVHQKAIALITTFAMLLGMLPLSVMGASAASVTVRKISTVAGTGTNGNADGASAAETQLNYPWGVAVDSGHNLYIADQVNQVIRKVDPAGNISIVAGTEGYAGYSGDNDYATDATLCYPRGVAVDSGGNLYIADTYNNVIRKVDASTHKISTIAGTGTGAYSGDNGDAASADLNQPYAIAVDSGSNVYIADTENNRIRKIDASTGNITTFAGTGAASMGYYCNGNGVEAATAALNQPMGVAVDSKGTVYIADTENNEVCKVGSDGLIRAVAGDCGLYGYDGDGGKALSAKLYYPHSVSVDCHGNLYIGDTQNSRVRKVNPQGTISTVAGNGTCGYSGDGSDASQAEISYPTGVASDTDGALYIADCNNACIRKIGALPATSADAANNTLELNTSDIVKGGTVTLTAAGDRQFCEANADGDERYVPVSWESSGDHVNHPLPIKENYIAGTRVYSCTFTPAAVGNFTISVTFQKQILNGADWEDASGGVDIKTADLKVEKASVRQVISTVAGTGVYGSSGDGGPAVAAQFRSPTSIAFDSGYNLYISDDGANKVWKVNRSGTISAVAGTGYSGYDTNPTATGAALYNQEGIAADSKGNLYIADTSNNLIRKVDANGRISNVAGNRNFFFSGDGGSALNASMKFPSDVAVDSKGNLYISDFQNNRIRKVDTSGIITTVAGTGTSGYSGDNGQATSAKLNFPSGLAIDSHDNLYIADESNQVIRKLDTASGIITTVAGTGTSGYTGDGGPASGARLNNPSGVAVDSAGALYIADMSNNVIRKVQNNVISTVAGNGTAGYSGDGDLAIAAQLYSPSDVAVDPAGNLYIADLINHCVRKVSTAAAGNTSNNTVLLDASSVKFGDTVTITAQGDRQSEAGTVPYDERYLPKSWVSSETGKSGLFTFANGAYTSSYTPSSIGSFVISVTFKKQVWNGSAWADSADSSTDTTQTAALTVVCRETLSSPSNLTWNSGTAQWGTVSNALDYIVQLYKNGISCGAPVITDSSSTQVDFSRSISSMGSGTYTFTVLAEGDGKNYGKSPESGMSADYSYSASQSESSASFPPLPPAVTDSPTNTTADLSGASFPADVTGVSLSITPIAAASGAAAGSTSGNTTGSTPGSTSDPQAAAAYNLAVSSAGLNLIGTPLLYNIKLLDQNGSPISSFTGTVTVRIPVPAGIHGTPHVFRYEESTGTFTDLGAAVQDGFLVFSTTHFSYYIVAGAGDSISLDTKSYQLPLNGKYQIGMKLTGAKAASVKVTSTNDKIAAATRLKNGNIQVTGKSVGTAYIMFDVYDNKNHLLTHASVRADVKTGIRPRGDSTRQIGVF